MGFRIVPRVALDPWEAAHFRWYDRLPPMVIFWRKGHRPAMLSPETRQMFEGIIRGCHLRFAYNSDAVGQ